MLELSDVYERAFGRVSVEGINAAWFLQTLGLHRRRTACAGRWSRSPRCSAS